MRQCEPLGRLALGSAVIAGAIENDLVILDAKARRRHFLDTIEAFFEFEYLTANAAQKVMMMALVRTFVTRRLAGNFHRDDVPVFRQRFEKPVNGCQSDRRHFLQGESLDFEGGQRVIVVSVGRPRWPVSAEFFYALFYK